MLLFAAYVVASLFTAYGEVSSDIRWTLKKCVIVVQVVLAVLYYSEDPNFETLLSLTRVAPLLEGSR